METADGHIWIATWNGLAQFDGKRFTSFTKAQGPPASIALAEDKDGSIWIGTLDDGALRLARGGFVAYAEEDGLARSPVRQDRTGSPDRHGVDKMRSRASALGASLIIQSSAGGTTTTLRMTVRQRRMAMLVRMP